MGETMGKRKPGPFEFDPLDAVGAVVSGDIFGNLFDGDDESEAVDSDNGSDGAELATSVERPKPVKRSNPFKPAASAKEKGKAPAAKGRGGEHPAEPDESDDSDETDDSNATA